jgi:predicted HNH restriction endonuclease
MGPEYDDKFLQETLARALAEEDSYCVPKGIIRFDYGNTHGWWVRVKRDNTPFRQLFSDGNGSIADSLNKAILYRHELLSSFPMTIKVAHSRSLPLEPEKRIFRVEEKGKNQPYIAWEAKWYDENHAIKHAHFSVKKFGEEEAKALALAAARKNHNRRPKLTKIPDNYFTHECKKILRADLALAATINSRKSSPAGKQPSEIISTDPFAFEGERYLVLHRSIERDRKIRTAKLTDFIQKHGSLFCELCAFRFSDTYPFLKKDIIEVHHMVPLSTLTKVTETKLTDLMLLCSNCHFAIHQGDAEENLLIAMECFEESKKKTS